MTSWLAKFRTSAALDRSGALPSQSAVSNEAREFTNDIEAVHRGLSQQPPAVKPPADLKFAIMNEVRASSRADNSSIRRNREFALRWLPAPVICVLVVMAAWWLTHHQHITPQQATVNEPSILAIGSALELGVQAPRDTPPVVVGPLTDELARVNRDLEKAGEFLLTSLP